MIPESWQSLALAPPRAWGPAVASARLRAVPEDFAVEELLGFEPAGEGAHVLLRVRKRDANTDWVARELARAAGCRASEVGFAGLKDRGAVATQWFSVPRTARTPASWPGVAGEGFEVLEAHAHARKLPRGALAGNRFTLRLTDFIGEPAQVIARLERVQAQGVPNYFGPQRFGRDCSNLQAAGGGAAPATARGPSGRGRLERNFALSAARSLVFNAILAERVRAGNWDRLIAGDLANLDGRGSVFDVEAADAELEARAARLELHPTGALWGRGAPRSGGEVHALECRVAADLPGPCALVESAGMEQERRALRLAVRDFTWGFEPGALVLGFRLTRGAFATAVLAEILGPVDAGATLATGAE